MKRQIIKTSDGKFKPQYHWPGIGWITYGSDSISYDTIDAAANATVMHNGRRKRLKDCLDVAYPKEYRVEMTKKHHSDWVNRFNRAVVSANLELDKTGDKISDRQVNALTDALLKALVEKEVIT